jgi:glutathione S-transferase
MMATLLGLSYSPWTEKARWALDVRHVPYDYEHYQPLVGEPALRIKLKRFTGRVSVPVLTDDEGRVHADSRDIAAWADTRGTGQSLFPPEHVREIDQWVALSERAMQAGRALSLARMLEDRTALAEMVPRPLRALGAVASQIGAFGIRRTLRKYGSNAESLDAHSMTLASALEKVRDAIAKSTTTPKTLTARFTFADIAMAQAVAFVNPPSSGLKLGAASRRAFTDPELSVRFADIVDWRDALYARYRGPE